jgi:hypothetical protein
VTAPEPVDAALIGRIVSRGRTRHSETVLRPTGRLAGWVSAGLAATLMIGFAAGAVVPLDDQSNDAVAELLFSASDEDLDGELL